MTSIFGNAITWVADRSGVPVWIVNEEAEIVYASVKETYIARTPSLKKFFSVFARDRSLVPQIKKFSANELYANFSFEKDGVRYFAVIGPAYELHPLSGGKRGTAAVLFREEFVKEALLLMPAVPLAEFCRYVQVLYEIVAHRSCEMKLLEETVKNYHLRDLLDEQLAETIFDIREEERDTAYAPDAEKKLFAHVTNGDVEAVQNFRMPRVKDPNADGNRSQELFEGVAIVTLATRAAIAGGLDYVAAYSLSDLYLKRLSRVSGQSELEGIVSQVPLHFARKVRESQDLQKKKVSSPYIRQGIQYIRAHLHGRVALEDVAQAVGLDPKYFSRLFVTVTGERFSSYVQRERIAEAKDLLANSSRTIIDVSNSLGFSSQSYFIKVFSEVVGETPGEFVKKYRVPHG